MLPWVVRWAPVRAATATGPELPALLDTRERERTARLVLAADRDAFVTAHALLRTVLGARLGIDGAAVRFAVAPGGRPELAGVAAREVAFSLTHARSMVACTVGPALPLGIDVETEFEALPDATLTAYACTPAERALLDGRAPGDRVRAFARLWTMKEAVLKALGTGLGVAPSDVECALDPPRIVRAPEPKGSGRWFVRIYEPRPHVVLTVAAYGLGLTEPDLAELDVTGRPSPSPIG